MFLKALAEYGSFLNNTLPVGYERRMVKWIIPLTEDGTLCGEFEPTSGQVRHGRKGKFFLIPKRRTKPRFSARVLVDNSTYVLGIGPGNRKQDHIRTCQLSFLKEAELCAEATGKSCIQAICSFLKRWLEKPGSVPRQLVATDVITFRVDNTYPLALAEIQDYCSKRYRADFRQNDTSDSGCMICARRAHPSKSLPFKIAGVPGAHAAGVSIVSIHRPAFESYGQKGTSGLPICSICAEAAARAANQLLDDPKSHVVVGSVAYIFWAAHFPTFDISALLTQPRPEEIAVLLGGRMAGLSSDEFERTRFHFAALSASTGRISVRDWFGSTTRHAIDNLQNFYRLQTALPGKHRPLSVLELTLAAQGHRGVVPAAGEITLWRSALTGLPLPPTLLWRVLQMSRICGITRPRAVLIHLCLHLGRREMIEQVTTSCPFLCGQILALLEEIQRRAVGETCASVGERFFGGASLSPALVLPQLLRKAKFHLQKLRRQRPAASQVLESRLQLSLSQFSEFPRCLSLNDQGLFALGYYQYKAARRDAMRDRGASDIRKLHVGPLQTPGQREP